MNLLHLKYALEIEKTRSINKAAANLYMGQPNLSRAIKELEKSLGVKLFYRTSKGMNPTPQGEEFLSYARKILAQVDQVEHMFTDENKNTQRFSVSAPRASYISTAFSNFCSNIKDGTKVEFYYQETNNQQAIKNITENGFHLGVVRYHSRYEDYFTRYLADKHLSSEPLMEFKYTIAVSRHSPLAEKTVIRKSELEDYVGIAHADPYVPSLPTHDLQKEDMAFKTNRHIFVYERASQFELLGSHNNVYMWVSPMPENIIDMYGLKQIECVDNDNIYKDILVCRKKYKKTPLDLKFVEELRNSIASLNL